MQVVYHGSYKRIEYPKIIEGQFTKEALKCLKFIDCEE